MVDPNRKINHLTDADVEFLQECEDEFGDRFEDTDESFMMRFEEPDMQPPLLEVVMDRYRGGSRGGGSGHNGGFVGRGGGGGGGGFRQRGGGGGHFNRRGGGGHFNKNWRGRGSARGSSDDGGHSSTFNNYRNQQQRSNPVYFDERGNACYSQKD